MLTTPSEIGGAVDALQKRFTLGPAFWVPVEARPDSTPGECYGDVERQAQEYGGGIVYGWTVWEWPRIMVEGEFHAVWKNPAGGLRDVSHKTDQEQRILFIPDIARTYQGHRIDNLRLALWDYPLVHEFIRLAEERARMMDAGRINERDFRVSREAALKLEFRSSAVLKKLMSFPRAQQPQ